MLPIPLDRELVFFDIESTGLNVIKDRILQIALIKLFPDQRPQESLELLINPGVLISDEAFAVHGISAQDVAKKPTFDQVAEKIWQFIGDADLAGYNSNRFDVPMLMEEFGRCGYEFSMKNRRLIDVQRIYYLMEPRTLSAALQFYTGQKMENAHNALSDVQATIDVLQGQLQRYSDMDYTNDEGKVVFEQPFNKDIDSLHQLCNDNEYLDLTNRIKLSQDGSAVFNFGKYRGRPVGETCAKDPGFYQWLQKMDFTREVKQIVKELKEAYEQANK